jgi:GTP cyclohydrolase I
MDKLEQLKYHYQEILKLIGEDVGREGLLKTPERAAKAILSLTKGYEMNAREILESAIFSEDIQNMVVVKDVEFYSLCEHHILPFFGKAHIAYIPNGKIVGLSKIPRIVDVFSNRLQVHERLTKQICEAINDAINPKGVMVVLEAQHLCMQMRGVEKAGSVTVVYDYCGAFEDSALRNEFLQMVK